MKKGLKQVGIFRNTERGYGFIDFEDEDKDSIFVAPNMIKDALNGDTVEFIIIFPKRRKSKSRRKNLESFRKK